MARLDGKTAVVTGGCSGIGKATAELFAEEGARVLVADVDEASGRAIADAGGGRMRYQRCDVTVEADLAAAMQAAVDAFGSLDVLFNNAGAAGARETVATLTQGGWDATLALVLRSAALGIRHAAPHMRARGGAVVSTSSVAAFQAGAAPAAYSVAKAGLLQLTRVAAAELARFGIRVNAVCPGLIVTPIFTAGMGLDAERRGLVEQELRRLAPGAQALRRAGTPRDVANAVLFLAGEESAFVTGTHLTVDGGLCAGPPSSWTPDAPDPLGAILAAAARPAGAGP